MSVFRKLSFGTRVDTGGFDSAVSKMTSRADVIQRDIGDKLGGMKAGTPAPAAGMAGASSAGAQQADQLGAAVLPLASKIQSAIVGAMAPLSSFATRFGAQFQQVGSTIVAISERIDAHLRFPTFQKGMTAIRAGAARAFQDAEGSAKRFGMVVDKTLAGIQLGSKIKSFVGSIGGLDGKLRALKAPPLDFAPATSSIATVKGATEAATGSMKRLGVEVALSLGAFGLVYKAVGFLKGGVSTAMGLGETMSKVGTIFGDETGKITGQADEMARRYGLVRGPLLDAASGFGLMGKAAGLTGPGVSDLATKMTKLAADVSSFYNIPFEEAAQKLRSGLAGEAEPLRALGVFISDAAVQQEAFRLGLIRTKDDMTEGIKVQARSSLAFKGLGDAMNDLERTQDSAANQARKFTGTVTNLGSTIGEMLLPALTKGLGLLNRFGTFALAVFESNKATLEGWGGTLADVVGRAGGAIASGFSAVSSFVGSMLPTFERVSGMATSTYATIEAGIGSLSGLFESAFGSEVVGMIGGFVEQFGGIAVVAALAVPVIGAVVSGFGLLAGLLTSAPVLIGGAAAGIVAITSSFVSWSDVIDGVGFSIRNMGEIFAVAQQMIGQKIAFLLDNFALIPTNLGIIAKWMATDYFSTFTTVLSALGKAIAAVGSAFWEWMKAPSGGIHFDFSGMMEDLKKAQAKLPALEVAKVQDIQPALDQQFDAITRKEAAFRKGLADRAAAAPVPLASKVDAAQPIKRGVVDPTAKEGATVKEMEKLSKFAETFKDKTQTAFEKYGEAMTDAKKALDAGLITKEQFGRADMYAKKDAGLDGERKFAGAAEMGSKEAYSAITRATSGRGAGLSNLEKINQDQLGVLKSVATACDSIAKAAATAPMNLMGMSA